MLTAMSKETTIQGGKVNFGMQPVKDKCKTFFLVGHDTTTIFFTWTMMLLASNTSWQKCVHKEVIEVCGHDDHPLDFNMLNKLKMVTLNFLSILLKFLFNSCIGINLIVDCVVGWGVVDYDFD
jgi:hypothetical protein